MHYTRIIGEKDSKSERTDRMKKSELHYEGTAGGMMESMGSIDSAYHAAWAYDLHRDECCYANASTCPECGSGMVRLGSCFSCPSCGYQACSY